jgi:dolichol kinase
MLKKNSIEPETQKKYGAPKKNAPVRQSETPMNEFLRQSIHALGTLSIIAGIWLIGLETMRILLATVLLLALAASVLYHSLSKKLPVHRLLLLVRRQTEKQWPLRALIIWNIGVLAALLIFSDSGILTIGLIPLAIGDSVSTVIGKRLGSITLMGKKTLEGTGAFFLATATVCLPFIGLPNALILGLVTAVLELMPIDDNITLALAGPFIAMLLI